MSSPPDDGTQRPPPWAGAPGYQAYGDGLPPHAPMPGAPPYPAAPPPLPPGPPAGRTGFGVALGAAAVWAVLNLVLALLISGPPPSTRAIGAFVGAVLLPTVIAAVATWLIRRRRRSPFWLAALVALPFYVLFRLLPLLATMGRA